MADPGAVERNEQINREALRRASQRSEAEYVKYLERVRSYSNGVVGQAEAHSRAMGNSQPIESLRASENLGSGPGTLDGELSWNGGMLRSHTGWGDSPTTAAVENAAGVSPRHITAPEPLDLGGPVIPLRRDSVLGQNMDQIAAQPIANPNTVRDRR